MFLQKQIEEEGNKMQKEWGSFEDSTYFSGNLISGGCASDDFKVLQTGETLLKLLFVLQPPHLTEVLNAPVS